VTTCVGDPATKHTTSTIPVGDGFIFYCMWYIINLL